MNAAQLKTVLQYHVNTNKGGGADDNFDFRDTRQAIIDDLYDANAREREARLRVNESKEMFKVVYTENGIKKEQIVKNEQQANQMARRMKGKVVSQMQEDTNEGKNYIVRIVNRDGDISEKGFDLIRFAKAEYDNEQIGLNKELYLYKKENDSYMTVLSWTNPKMEENVSVGAAIGTAAEPTVYVPDSHNGFTGGPFGGKPKRRN